MRVVIQRVRRARVTVGEEVVGDVGRGLLVLLGVTHGDTIESLAGWRKRRWGCASLPTTMAR